MGSSELSAKAKTCCSVGTRRSPVQEPKWLMVARRQARRFHNARLNSSSPGIGTGLRFRRASPYSATQAALIGQSRVHFSAIPEWDHTMLPKPVCRFASWLPIRYHRTDDGWSRSILPLRFGFGAARCVGLRLTGSTRVRHALLPNCGGTSSPFPSFRRSSSGMR